MTAPASPPTVLAVDPGRQKCGLAVVRGGAVLLRRVVPTEFITEAVRAAVADAPPQAVLVGDSTNARAVREAVAAALPPGLAVQSVPERFTTQRARERFLRENPAPGWRRLLPIGLRTPDRPVDDYAAVILAEDYLAGRGM